MKDIVVAAINEQIRAEFHSAYIYLGMSAWCVENNLPGFAHWLRMQWQEETMHAMKLFDFMHSRSGAVQLLPIDAPARAWSSPLDIFEHVREHEAAITERINVLYDLALEHRDRPLQILLQWSINEQVEEEAQVQDLIERLKLIGGDGPSVYLLDRQLAGRAEPTMSTTGA